MATKTNTKQQNKTFGTFYKYLQGLENYNKDYAEDLKESIVLEFSKGKTTSLKTIHEDYPYEYFKMMEWMKNQQKPSAYSNEGEKWRRRVLAAICSYLDASGRRFDEKSKKISYAMTIACRSANRKSFNKISVTALRKVYYTFGGMKKDLAVMDSKGYMGTTVKDWQDAVNNALRANSIRQTESNN